MPFFQSQPAKPKGKKVVYKVNVAGLLADHLDLEEECDKKDRLITQLRDEQERTQEELNESKSYADFLQNTLSNNNHNDNVANATLIKLRALKHKNNELIDKQRNDREEMEGAQQQIDKLKTRERELKEKYDHSEKSSQEVQRNAREVMEGAQQQINKLKTRERELKEKCDNSEKCSQELQAQIKELSTQLRNAKGKTDRNLAQSSDSNKGLQRQYSDLRNPQKDTITQRHGSREPKLLGLVDWSNELQIIKDEIAALVEWYMFPDPPTEPGHLGQIKPITQRMRWAITSHLLGWLDEGVRVTEKSDIAMRQSKVEAVYVEVVAREEHLAIREITGPLKENFKAKLEEIFREAVCLWSKVSQGQ